MFKCPAKMKTCEHVTHLTESRFSALASAVSYRNMFINALV